MPIKPENKSLYPKNWKEIVANVRERSGDRCEWEGCNCKNGADGVRYPDGRFEEIPPPFPEVDPHGTWFDRDFWEVGGAKLIHVVLTTAHLDHDPTNSDLSNLRHWCQYHHLRYDAKHHAETARTTRRTRELQTQPEFFTEAR